ncbi:MAG: Ig-like domain-containing protein [Planctomycetaceae bacterium]|jgi:hypothetical protein|nr:Ig-like domain-containing protein [Planctomycetaceae bacterium]
MNMKRVLILGIIPVLSVLLLLTGCNKSKVIKTDVVTGRVTLDGTPFAGATVNFTPKESTGNPAYAMTGEDGTYKLQTLLGDVDAGTTPGEYIVTIFKTDNQPSGQKIPDPDHPGQMLDVMKPKEALPMIYKDPKKTPFSATVIAEQANVFDFDLKSKP